MEEYNNDRLREACVELREIIANNKAHLDDLQEQIDESKAGNTTIDRLQIGKAGPVAALETMKHSLAYMKGGLKVSDCQPNFVLTSEKILISCAKIWKNRTKTEIQELLVEEKIKQSSLNEEKKRIEVCLNENKQLLEVHLKEKTRLESKQEEIEEQRISELEEKLPRVIRAYEDMKLNLAEIVEKYFPEPKVPGYNGMYSLLTDLTRPLQLGKRNTYIEVTSSVWPYFLEILEANGIVERHPTDKKRIRIIDFSDGQFGS